MSLFALAPHAAPVNMDDLARLYVLEDGVEVLTAENEILKRPLEFLERQLAAAEARAAQETVKAMGDRCASGAGASEEIFGVDAHSAG